MTEHYHTPSPMRELSSLIVFTAFDAVSNLSGLHGEHAQERSPVLVTAREIVVGAAATVAVRAANAASSLRELGQTADYYLDVSSVLKGMAAASRKR